MKAVVLEVRGKEAVVLTTDGKIIKIRQKNLTTGDTIELSEKQAKGNVISYREILRYGSVAAAVALILGSGGLYSYNNVVACSYVSLDSTPSIEYTLNRKNLVLDVTALNEEATEIVQELKDAGVKKSTLSEAMEMTAGLLEKYGYLDTDATDYVLINESSVSDRKNAKSLGISSGEYQEIQRIKENETADSKPKISADDIDKYGGLGVRELLENSGQLEKKEEPAQPVGKTQPTQSNGGEKQQEKSENENGVGQNDNKEATSSKRGEDSSQESKQSSDGEKISGNNTNGSKNENNSAQNNPSDNSNLNAVENADNNRQPDNTAQEDKATPNGTPQEDNTNQTSNKSPSQADSGAPGENNGAGQFGGNFPG